MLKDTGDKELAECAPDKLFGVGFTLREQDKTNKSKWSGKNILGKMLQETRDTL